MINIGWAPAEQMKQPEGRFINNTLALIPLSRDCTYVNCRQMISDSRACAVVSLSNTLEPG